MKVSIIVPVYNVENLITRCVDSLINQTHKNLEIILINDGSTDKSLETILGFNDERIIVFSQENKGVNIARKKGIELSTGDYIMFVDSDDYLDFDTIEKLLIKSEDEPVDVIKFGAIVEPLGAKRNCINKTLNKNDIYNYLINTTLLHNLWGSLYKSELIKRNIEVFDTKICNGEDFHANLRILSSLDKLVYLDECFYHYCVNPNSTTNIDNIEKIKKNAYELQNVNYELFEYLKEWNINTIENRKAVALIIFERNLKCVFKLFKSKKVKIDDIVEFIYELFGMYNGNEHNCLSLINLNDVITHYNNLFEKIYYSLFYKYIVKSSSNNIKKLIKIYRILKG